MLLIFLQYLGNSSLHNEKVRVVDIQLNRSEKVLHTIILHVGTVDKVLVFTTHDNLQVQKVIDKTNSFQHFKVKLTCLVTVTSS